MELDALKSGWKKDPASSPENRRYIEQLPAILNGKTVDIITSIRKKYEKIITILIGSMMLVTLAMPLLTDGYTYPGSPYGFTKAMFFYQILLVFYWMKLRTVSHLTLSDGIQERMEQLLTLFRKSMRIEVTFILLFLLSVLLVGRFVYGKGMHRLDDIGVVIGFPASLVTTGVMILLVRKRYNGKIKELKTYLEEYRQAQAY